MNFKAVMESGRYELLFSTGLSLSVRVLSALAAFVTSLVIGREMGATESGYYFLAFSLVTFIAGVSRIGLDNTILRYVGSAFTEHSWHCVRSVVSKGLLLATGVALLAAVLLSFASVPLAVHVFGKPELAPALAAMAPGVVGLSVFTLLAMALQGLRRIVASVMTLNILSNVFLVALLLGLGLSSAEHAAWAYSAAAMFTLLCGGFFLWSVLRRLRAQSPCLVEPQEISWRELFQSCMPLWVVLIMSQLVQWSGQFIAGAYVEPAAVAQLAVAMRTAMLTSFVLMAVNLVVAPRFAAMYKQGQLKELEKLALTSVKLMVLFALPIVVVMLAFPEFLMGLFGEGFSGGAHLLQILVIGQFVNVVTGSVGYLLTMSGHEKDFRNTVLISGPIAVGLAFALTPIWGATGSAIATAVAVATQNLVAVWQVKRRLGFNTLVVWRR
ncbi:oligosaccharide flippase family protein [Microbulbifer pacificus]|uniref:oligosaccharide flippase family protein n=1 Tax=Microbulbifer pacificus TaxID=407164 RepID=UPI000CF5250C|nr:oligosaccharide flippase family protein [Microbulbifer pacificus]